MGIAERKINWAGIAVLARAPIPGTAKTRLIPILGAAGAAQFQADCIHRTIKLALRCFTKVHLWCSPSSVHPFFQQLNVIQPGLKLHNQCEGELGDRMYHVLQTHCRRQPALLVGTDCPALSDAHLTAAARALRAGNQAVITPAADGGYVLIGLTKAHKRLFSDIAWGSENVWAHTRTRLHCLGLRYCEMKVLRDVDEPEDLVAAIRAGLFPDWRSKLALLDSVSNEYAHEPVHGFRWPRYLLSV